MLGRTVVVLALLESGCSNIPPRMYPVPEPVIVPAARDSVWPSVIEVVSDYRLAIQTIDRTSGIVQTEAMRDDNPLYWDCGQEKANLEGSVTRPVPVYVLTTFTITATPAGRDSTRVRVVTNPERIGRGVCTSTGTLEGRMAAAVLSHWINRAAAR